MLKNRFFDISTQNKCRACSLYKFCRVGHFLHFVDAKWELGFVLFKKYRPRAREDIHKMADLEPKKV